MLIVHVHVRVKPERVEVFMAASFDSMYRSVQEPGIAQFDETPSDGFPPLRGGPHGTSCRARAV